jgi:hypothetical protein
MAAGAQAGIDKVSISRWWRVVGGLSMNLALGSLNAWSVFVVERLRFAGRSAGGPATEG